MRIRLGVVSPNRTRLRRRAGLYLALSLCGFGLGIRQMLLPMSATPIFWIVSTVLLYSLGILFMARGFGVLNCLMRTLECYEDAIVYENKEIPLAQITLLSWEVRHRFLLDTFWYRQPVCRIFYSKHITPLPPSESTALSQNMFPSPTVPPPLRSPRLRCISFWEEDFQSLRQTIDAAYEHSLPERFYTK